MYREGGGACRMLRWLVSGIFLHSYSSFLRVPYGKEPSSILSPLKLWTPLPLTVILIYVNLFARVCVCECVCGKCVPGVHRKMAINSCRTWPLLFGPHDKQRTSTSFSRQAYLAYPPTKSTQKALKQIVCTVVSTMKRCCH